MAIVVAVVALVLATTIAGPDSERLATTAYLAAIFAAIVLVAQRFLPAPADERTTPAPIKLPSFLGFLFAVLLLLVAAAGFASDPVAEALLFVACIAFVTLAILSRTGALGFANASLVRGGFAVGATRYALAFAVCALAFAAFLPAEQAGAAANVAYRLAIVATVFFAFSLFASTPAAASARRHYGVLMLHVDRLGRELAFARTARYAAIGAAIVLIPASLLLAPYSEPFAVGAYLAAVAAAFGVAMECRRLRG